MERMVNLRELMRVEDTIESLNRVTTWLRGLSTVNVSDFSPRQLPPTDTLARDSFLYPCLRSLMRTIKTAGDGDCALHSIWGSCGGTSSTAYANILRGTCLAIILRNFDFFLGVQAATYQMDPEENAESFCKELSFLYIRTAYLPDCVYFAMSHLLAREIHLYKPLNKRRLNGTVSFCLFSVSFSLTTTGNHCSSTHLWRM